ncbi:hypothetical protein Bhyg_09442 [Pseudolycoriella hygida]|uniref:Uncharacterized protein n=1 Tax=Pseudolycoriella hygida TaxID=35572 RepID=A0A9Q0S5A4_9DIPT|nr:hypothetical protein Bhyg_09442 [Pseudolycoriella hygida]
MIRGCPYEGDLSVNKMPLTGALFQYIFVPAGDYKLVLNTTLNERKTSGLLTMVYVSVAAGRTLEDDRMGALFQYIFVPAGDYKLVVNATMGEKKIFGFLLTAYISVAAGRTLEDDRMG